MVPYAGIGAVGLVSIGIAASGIFVSEGGLAPAGAGGPPRMISFTPSAVTILTFQDPLQIEESVSKAGPRKRNILEVILGVRMTYRSTIILFCSSSMHLFRISIASSHPASGSWYLSSKLKQK